MNTDFLSTFLKNKNNRILYIIFIIGIVLMLFSGHSKEAPSTPQKEYNEEEQLSRIISGIEGAGSSKVMVTYYGSGTSNIVYDTKTRGDQTDRTAVVSDGEAVSVGESYPRVKGVVVVAKGATDAAVRTNIINAVTVALDVPEYKVAVFEGK